jgi:3-methylcrotonyl-CoA carboxylase alpha subunit
VKEKEEIPVHVPIIGYLMHTLTRNPEKEAGHGEKQNLWEAIGFWRDLMAVRIRFEEQEHTVNIPRFSAGHFYFEIKGQPYQASTISCSHHRIEFTTGHHNYVAWISGDNENHAFLTIGGHIFRLKRHDILAESISASLYESAGHDSDHVTYPMPGKVIKIHAKAGDAVKKGDVLLIIEAMKMENLIVSPRDAVVKEVNVAVNDRVESSKILIGFE